MVSQHPAKFGGSRLCGSANIMFTVVEEQDSTCFSLGTWHVMSTLKHMACYASILHGCKKFYNE